MKLLAIYSGYVRLHGVSGQLFATRRCEWQPSQEALRDLGVNSITDILTYKAGYFMMANVMGLEIKKPSTLVDQEKLVLNYLVQDQRQDAAEKEVFISDQELQGWLLSLMPEQSPQGFLDYVKNNYVTSIFRYRIARLILDGHIKLDIDFDNASANIVDIDFANTKALPLTDIMVIDQMVKSYCGKTTERLGDLAGLPEPSLQRFTDKILSSPEYLGI